MPCPYRGTRVRTRVSAARLRRAARPGARPGGTNPRRRPLVRPLSPTPTAVSRFLACFVGGIAALMAVSAAHAQPGASSPAAPRVDALGIEVGAGAASRPFVVTDGQAAYLYGEAGAAQRTAWQGFNVRGKVFVDDWAWTVGGRRLTARDLTGATVLPHEAHRRYGIGAGTRTETVALLDGASFVEGAPGGVTGGAAAMVVELDGSGPRVDAFEPLVADRRDAAAFDVRVQEGRGGTVLLVARRDHMTRRSATDAPVWLAVFSPDARAEATSGPGLVEVGGVDGTLYAPGRLVLPRRRVDAQRSRPRDVPDIVVALAVGDTPEAAAAAARRAARDHVALRAARLARMQALLDRSFVVTPDARVDVAFAWARLSLDALVMNQRGVGIFAGLPWFNNYWGRDTFLSLPGTALARGVWETARSVLDEFARHQDTR